MEKKTYQKIYYKKNKARILAQQAKLRKAKRKQLFEKTKDYSNVSLLFALIALALSIISLLF